MINCKRSKIWGSTSCLFNKNNVEIHRIEAKKDSFCSVHKHEHKTNIFFVEQGLLKITIYRTDAGKEIKDETLLGPGDMTYVENGLDHKFEAMEDTIAFEIYYLELDQNDIVRKNVGGVNV